MKRDISFQAGLLLVLFCGIMVFFGAFSSPQDQKIDLILEAIKAKGAQWIPKDSRVSRLSVEQFKKMLGDKSREISSQEPIKMRTLESYPASIDWRNKNGLNYITSVRDQTDYCGSCVAFDAVAALESLICIENNRPSENLDLSEMNIFMCGGGSCVFGWYNNEACNYMNWYGVPDEFCWPYVPENSLCENTCSNKYLRDVQIDDYGFIIGQEAYKMAISFAPIMTSMKVYQDFASGGHGIYEHVWGDYLGMHSICIIGYNTLGQTPYWIAKNSWGTDWGEDGFCMIKMGECEIEAGGYWISGANLPSIPISPSDLHANYGSDGYINLGWHDDSNNEMIFEVQRRLGNAEFGFIANVPERTTSYLDTEVSGETAYSYRISGINIAGPSEFSNIVNVTTPPLAPTALVATAMSDSTARLEWQDNSSAEDGFEVWQKIGSGNWTLNTSVGPNICSTEIVNLAEYTKYYFRVRAFNINGSSAWSNETSLTTLIKAPSNLIATASGSDSIYLYWQDNSSKESGFEIWQQENGGNWQLKCTVGANVNLTEIIGLTPGMDYCYKIRAYKVADQSGWSNTSCATTHSGVPAAPSNLQVAGYCWEVELMWTDNSNNESGFNIYRQSGSVYFWIATVGPNTTTFWDTDLFCGQRWCYKVRSFNENGNSPACYGRCCKTSPCYECQGGFGLNVVPDKALIKVGDNVTYTYKIENKGEVDLSNVEVTDSAFGQIASNGILKKGEIMIVTRAVALSKSLTNIVKATGTYITPTKETKYVSAHASATVEIR